MPYPEMNRERTRTDMEQTRTDMGQTWNRHGHRHGQTWDRHGTDTDTDTVVHRTVHCPTSTVPPSKQCKLVTFGETLETAIFAKDLYYRLADSGPYPQILD